MKKTDKSFKELTGQSLDNNSILNMFDILQDSDNNYLINIFKSYILDDRLLENPDLFHLYTIKNDDWWDQISYKYYGTPKLWWLITMVNRINNPFEDYNETDIIKILKREYLYDMIKSIKKMRNL